MALRSPIAPFSPFTFNSSPLPKHPHSPSKPPTPSISTTFSQTFSISTPPIIPSLLSSNSLQELLANPINFVRGKNMEKRSLEDNFQEGSNKRPRIKYNIKEYCLKFMPTREAGRVSKPMNLHNRNENGTTTQDRARIPVLLKGETRTQEGTDKLDRFTPQFSSIELAAVIERKKEEKEQNQIAGHSPNTATATAANGKTQKADPHTIRRRTIMNDSEIKPIKHVEKEDKVEQAPNIELSIEQADSGGVSASSANATTSITDDDTSTFLSLHLTTPKEPSSQRFPEAECSQKIGRETDEGAKVRREEKVQRRGSAASASPNLAYTHGVVAKGKEITPPSSPKTNSSLKRSHEEDEKDVRPLAKKQNRTVQCNTQTSANISTASSNSTKFWDEFPAEQFQDKRAKGISNGGLWCYRNASVQALLHVPAIYDFFVNCHTSCKLRQCISCELREFATVHYCNKGFSATNERLAALQRIDIMLGGPFAKRKNHQQQDADEYTTLLLDKAIEQLKNGDKKKRTPLEEILEVVIVQSVVCTKCKHKSITRTRGPTMRAQFPTGAYKPANLEKLIGDLEQQSRIPDYKCEKCSHKGALMRRRFAELPSSLLIHVNRGGVLDAGINRGRFSLGTRKIAAHLIFKTEMTLETANGSTQNYQLRSLVSHAGSSLHGGHYVSFVRNPHGEKWSFCNDSNVSPRDEKRVLHDQNYYNPYILFYSKIPS